MKKSALRIISLVIITLIFCACTRSAEVGSDQNPVKFYIVPAQDVLTLTESAKKIEKFLKNEMKMNVSVEVPANYIAVVEALGSKRADVAIINTLGYILARDKYQVEPRLKLVNRGRDEYYGQIIVHKDGIKKIQDLKDKKFAFVDPTSTSGYLLPQRLLKKENIQLKEFIFAGKHDGVVMAVYQKKVDAGATFYTPPDPDGTPKDARWILRTQYPDVFDKVRILQLTESIPNDPVVFRKDLPEEIKVKMTNALRKYITSDEGRSVLLGMYHITDFKEASDKDYDRVRSYLKDLNQKADSFIK